MNFQNTKDMQKALKFPERKYQPPINKLNSYNAGSQKEMFQ